MNCFYREHITNLRVTCADGESTKFHTTKIHVENSLPKDVWSFVINAIIIAMILETTHIIIILKLQNGDHSNVQDFSKDELNGGHERSGIMR